MENEVWKVIDGQERYEVSSLGRVRRISTGRLMKPAPDRKGYLHVGLYENGRKTTRRLAGIVARAFIGPRPHGYEINHIDGIKTNNALSNLEYCTQAENDQHAVRTGLKARGEKHGLARLTADKVRELRQRYATGTLTYSDLAKEFGIDWSTCARAINKQTWAHVA